MEKYYFKKKTKFPNLGILLTFAIFSFIILSYLKEYLSSSTLFLIISTLFYIVVRYNLKKNNNNLRQIDIDENNLILYFQNLNKNRLTLDKNYTKLECAEDKCSILVNGEVRGVFFKTEIKETRQWEELISSFGRANHQ